LFINEQKYVFNLFLEFVLEIQQNGNAIIIRFFGCVDSPNDSGIKVYWVLGGVIGVNILVSEFIGNKGRQPVSVSKGRYNDNGRRWQGFLRR
jgi:hypothetical protein